jgi:thiamine biosynthesis lipoprotein
MLFHTETGCRSDAVLYKDTFPTMSTFMTVGIYAHAVPDWTTIREKTISEALLYDYRSEQSPLFSLNNEGEALFPNRMITVIKQALDLAEASGGAFDPTIYPLLRLWQFETGGKVPSHQEITEILPLIDYTKVTLYNDDHVSIAPQMGLDLGGIAKGAVVDYLGDYLTTQGYTDYIVDAGGDLLVSGAKPDGTPWKIAVRHPRYTRRQENNQNSISHKRFACIIELDCSQSKKAIVTSGDYERFFIQNGRRYHHIIDPHTGYPATDLVSVTVIADNCTIADGLATAAFALGYRKGLEFLEQQQRVEALLIREKNHRLEAAQTSGFPLHPQDLML